MSRRYFQFSLVVFTITFFGLSAIASVLEGKNFTGQEVLVGKKASGVDEVVFKDGKFISSGCIEWGFSGGDYATTADGENVHFVADTYSDKYGRITWTGTVNGDHLDATFIWFDKRKYSKPEQIKWFSGNVKLPEYFNKIRRGLQFGACEHPAHPEPVILTKSLA